jgi:prevent-host-death family protein
MLQEEKSNGSASLPLKIDLRNTVSLTDFRKRPSELLDEAATTNSPVVITVNGSAKAVALSVDLFHELVDLAEETLSLRSLRKGLDQVEEGDTIEAEEFLEGMRSKHGLSD